MDTVKKYFKYLFCLVLLLLSVFTIDSVKADRSSSSDIILTFTEHSIEETVSGSGYIITGTSLEINREGTYRIKGRCTEGNISVKKGTKNVVLILDNLYLASSTTGPIVVKKDGADVTIKSIGISTIIDNENPENEYNPNPIIADLYEGAAIKVKSDSRLTFGGTGTLNIIANTNNGIKGSQQSTITINSGVIDIESVRNGISGDDKIIINNGIINIQAENEGIKLEPNIDDTESEATLTINGGKTVIHSGQDGIQAIGDININGWTNLEITSMEDAIQTRSNFTMTNGNIDIHTYEGYSPTTFDKDGMSAKGIKAAAVDEMEENATNTITITGGTINIDSSDDGIHSDGYIYITRGTVTVRSGDDGIHSDTKLVFGTQGGLERDPEINVLESIEGIESGNVYVYSGKIKVISLDDGINAAGGASSGSGKQHGEHFNPDTGQMEDNYAIYVYGGSIYVNCEGDGLDANGSIYLYGGTHIIYHQDAQGNNSALDRDAKLVIDGATVFSAGGVADNGVIDSTGSNQKIYIDTTDYSAHSKLAVYNGNEIIFNDEITKRSTYTFYTSPDLVDGSSIGEVQELIDVGNNPWVHEFSDGVVTTPATPEQPGIITYTCTHSPYLTERKTYFYSDTVEFNFINKTNAIAAVTISGDTHTGNFTTTDVDEYIYITTNQEVEFIGTIDGILYEELSGLPTTTPNVYKYHVDPSTSKTFYIVLNGDVNMDGVADITDSTIIADGMISPSNPLYRELSPMEKIIADGNDNGIINSHDGLDILKNLSGDEIYGSDYFDLTDPEPVVLDGEHDGEVVVEFITKKDIVMDAMDGYYYPNADSPSSNGFIELTGIEGNLTATYAVIDIQNGFAGFVEEAGIPVSKNVVMCRITYKVAANTPTGVYPVTLKIGSVTAHGSDAETSFTLRSDVIVKGTTDPTTAFFSGDEGVASIDAYHTQNYNNPDETNVSSTTVRDPDSGEIVVDGAEGQVNFKVNLNPGYVISSIDVTPKDKYKNIKGPADTGNGNTYRVTKVTGDIEIAITTKIATEFTAEFNKDKNISSIDVYYTKDYTGGPDQLDVDKTYARDGDTGAIDISGEGQINFKVNPKPGYKVDKVEVSGNYKNLKEQEDGIYRVTKISGDLIVNVKSSPRTAVVPDVTGIQEGYTYTGKAIKPEPTISVTITAPNPDTGEDEQITIPLAKNKDYRLTYGDNINAGLDAGSVTITSLGGSQFIFDPITVEFNINKYQLTETNINAPSSIVYTGSTLTPEVTVNAVGKTLVEGTDYDITFTNQDGSIGENIVATVVGKGNFKGTVDNINILITDKATQIIEFDESEVTKTYGEDFTMTATIVQGDGTIRYTSNNTEVAVVDENTGAITLVGTGQSTIRAYASETAAYAEAVTSYKLIVRKAPLTIIGASVEDKYYDGNNEATVTGITFDGLVKDEQLVIGTDYTVTGYFIDSLAGNDKLVNVAVDLSYDTIKRYSLQISSFEGSASIIPIGIDPEGVTLSETSYTYSGEAKEPTPTVEVGGVTLTEGVDYVVSYIDNVDVGEAYAVIAGIGNYASGSPIVKPFSINKKTVNPSIESIEDVTYTGTYVTPAITVKDGDDVLVLDRDYSVEYFDNVDVGEASVKITKLQTSDYDFDDTTASCSQTFDIKPYKLKAENIELEYKFVKYDGLPKEPAVTVTYNGMTLVEDIDYIVAYSDNTNVTTEAKVTVTAISTNLTGNPTVEFEISDRDELIIYATDNQSVTYTGSPVVLSAVDVSENDDYITADDLVVKYYDTDDNEIEKPTNVGKYYVIYSYDGTNYKGTTKVNFEITKANSSTPSEMTANLTATAGDPLSSITLTSEGLTWNDSAQSVVKGNKNYEATYTQNNDPDNYTTITVDIPVYGKSITTITTSVDGTGGSISGSVTGLVEGEQTTITFTPLDGYEIDRVLVDGEEVLPTNNQLVVTGTTEDMSVVVTYKTIKYNMDIYGVNSNVDPYGIIEVERNFSESITLSAKEGYKLTSVKVNNVERISDVTNNTITIYSINADTEVSVNAEKISYEVIDGARQEYIINKHTFAKFEINAEYNLFENGGKVYVDNKLVDTKNYTSEEGSTIITFNRSYMDSLSLGAHTLRVEFTDGGDASCIFRVALLKYKDKEQNPIINPTTGDHIVTFIIVLSISILGLIILILKRRKMS